MKLTHGGPTHTGRHDRPPAVTPAVTPAVSSGGRDSGHVTELARAQHELINTLGALAGVLREVFEHHDGRCRNRERRHTAAENVAAARASIEDVAEECLAAAQQIQDAAADTMRRVESIVDRSAWMTTGLPITCWCCGQRIDPAVELWQVCRGWPEHDVCHIPDPAAEAACQSLATGIRSPRETPPSGPRGQAG